MTNETFTASNGIEIEISQDRYLLGNGDYGSGPTYATAGPEGIDALREYFQAERDTELGRWRDPEAPDVVVYHLPSAKREATGRTVRVLDERLGAAAICNEHLERSSDPTNAEPTAKRYFAAHPEPKPWHDAKPGEAWALTIDGTEHLAQTITGRIAIYPHDADPEFFIPTLIPANTIGDIWEHTWSPSDQRITAGRRIWPEPEESDDGR
ncbi:MAG TPA: hypothetical protein VK054_06525 [Beutenbergiaceae bacterium]|nr:hypothetical protein [Beutenbergiaceae bacterium]